MSEKSFNEVLIEMKSNYSSESDEDPSEDYFLPNGAAAKKAKKQISNPAGANKSKNKKPSIAHRKLLAQLVHNERLLWDVEDKRYANSNARNDAWTRITEKMPGTTVDSLKVMWKSLRDLARYHKTKVANVGNESDNDNWEFKDCLSYIMDRPRKRKSSVISEAFDSFNYSKCSDDSATPPAVSQSNFDDEPKQCKPEKYDDPLYGATRPDTYAARTSTSIAAATQQPHQQIESVLKYAYVWQHLERLYQKLSDEAIDEMNIQFINQAYEKTKKKSDGNTK